MLNIRVCLCYFACVSILFNIISCQRSNGKITEILVNLEGVIEQNPDSVLTLLDSIVSPFDLNKEEYNKYLLLQVQAKDKAYKDISSETQLFQVKNYYLKKKDVNNAALATYYCGRILQEQNKDQEAIKEYITAEDYAKETGNNNLRALISSSMGSVFFKQFILSEAKSHFLKAASYFRVAKNSRNEITTYNNIGNTCLLSSENDSALFYYRKGLTLAESVKDSVQMSMLRMSIGVTYRQQENYDEAISNFVLSARILPESSDKSKLLLNLSKTFLSINQLDSARYYVEKSLSLTKKGSDIFVKTGIYKTLSEKQ